MNYFPVTISNNKINIEGLPNAVRLIRLSCRESRQLSDFSLHRNDLVFSQQCLQLIEANNCAVNEALWRCAIIYYIKCYGSSKGRNRKLDFKTVFQGNKMAIEVHKYFNDLRRKHLVHDENSFLQGITMAAINNGNQKYKIEKILCSVNIAATQSPENFKNLALLIEDTLAYVDLQFDKLCGVIASNLEKLSYEELVKRDAPIYNTPKIEHIGMDRNKDG